MNGEKSDQETDASGSASRRRPPSLVVGIGASAGGLAAFKSFFDNMPADTGMAFVLVQHLDPDHKSLLVDRLRPHTAMQVVEAQDRAELAPNQIHVIPPNATLTLEGDTLRVSTPMSRVRRRQFIALLWGALAVWPLGTPAQQVNVATIGVLVHAAPGWERFWQLFPEVLRDIGYAEGKNIRFEFRSDQGQITRLPELAAELVRLKVNVIVPWFTPAAIAAKEATREIPIICAACGDMVGTGLVESLARPGGNVTGNSTLNAELAGEVGDPSGSARYGNLNELGD